MIYLTGQLIVFLIVTASVGFMLGWLLRGSMLPVSAIKNAEVFLPVDSQIDQSNYMVSGLASEKGPGRD